MTRFLNSRSVLFLTSMLLCAGVACTDDGTSDEGMETTGDGDGDPGDGDGDGDGDGAPGDGDGDAALSHAADIQPIWDASCVNGCHTAGGVAATLDMSTDAHDNIVGVNSTQATDKQLVEAGNAANSYLVAKLRGTQADLGGSGANMPNGGMALDDATITMIEEWIDAGALP